MTSGVTDRYRLNPGTQTVRMAQIYISQWAPVTDYRTRGRACSPQFERWVGSAHPHRAGPPPEVKINGRSLRARRDIAQSEAGTAQGSLTAGDFHPSRRRPRRPYPSGLREDVVHLTTDCVDPLDAAKPSHLLHYSRDSNTKRSSIRPRPPALRVVPPPRRRQLRARCSVLVGESVREPARGRVNPRRCLTAGPVRGPRLRDDPRRGVARRPPPALQLPRV